MADQLAAIDDADIRGLMEGASVSLDKGDRVQCVQACADAYLLVLRTYPEVLDELRTVLKHEPIRVGIERGMLRNAPLMWPRFAAKLTFDGDEPSIVFDRKNLGLGETIQYYEFTLSLIGAAERGDVKVDLSQVTGVAM